MIFKIIVICILAICISAESLSLLDTSGRRGNCEKREFRLFYGPGQQATFSDAQKKCSALRGGKLAAIDSGNINRVSNWVHRILGNSYGVACWIGSWNGDPYSGKIALGQGTHIGEYPDEPRPFLCECCVDTPICEEEKPSCCDPCNHHECPCGHSHLYDKCRRHHRCKDNCRRSCEEPSFEEGCGCGSRCDGRTRSRYELDIDENDFYENGRPREVLVGSNSRRNNY